MTEPILELIPREQLMMSLTNSLEDIDWIRGTTAFWTIFEGRPEPKFSERLKRGLIKGQSYFCTDISTFATNIDAIDSYANYGCNFYVFSYKLSLKLDETSSMLQHSKMILIKKGDKAIIYIGSHNFTNRALAGLNIEHTIRIETDYNSEIANQFEYAIEQIRINSLKFDPNQKDIYKLLQDGKYLSDNVFPPMLFLHVKNKDFNSINIDTVMLLLSFTNLEIEGNKIPDYKQRDFEVLLYTFNDNGDVKIFKSKVIGTNETDESNAATKDGSISTNFIGLWIRSLTYFVDVPIYMKKVEESVSGRIFDISGSRYYKLKIEDRPNFIYKVKKGKDGFKKTLKGWVAASEVNETDIHEKVLYDKDINPLFNHHFETKLSVFNQELNTNPEKKNIQKPVLQRINPEIFNPDFISKSIQKNKKALERIRPKEMIDLNSKNYLMGLRVFEDVFEIVFALSSTTPKLSQIEKLVGEFKDYKIRKREKTNDRRAKRDYFNNMTESYYCSNKEI